MMNPGFPNNMYGPSGWNDNNFNRRRFPSNMYPGGQNGNPLGQFTQLSTNTQNNMRTSMTNFNKSYAINDPMIERMVYSNNNDILHNNIADPVLDEHIVEYKINIDSLDRDIRTYPDPFNFAVKFNAPSGGKVRTEVLDKGELVTVDDYFPGHPGPSINKQFRNVKYIKLESIVLPQYFKSKIVDGEQIVDPSSFLVDDRFLFLVVDELVDRNLIYSTYDNNIRTDPSTGMSINPPRPFGLIFPDTKLGNVYYTGTPYNSGHVFKNSHLGNIQKLTLKLFDSCGQQLKVDPIYTFEELKEAKKNGTPIPLTDLRHPLNKNIQVHYTFIIGVVESQVNTNTKFEL